MSEIKLVAIDLDDTLLKNDLTISPRAKEAIRQAAEKNVFVTLATGRMYCSALPYAQELGLDLPLITYQGALVKYADGREVYHRPIPLALAKEVVDFILPYGYHLNVYIDDQLYMGKDSPEGQRYLSLAKVPLHLVDNLSEALTKEPSKLLIIAQPEELDNLSRDIREAFGTGLNIVKSRSTFLEISHPQATKGTALMHLAKSLGLTAPQVMAIGDSLNDLDMLEYAGLGVAMSNAMPELKKAARFVTKTNNDDGVAEAIENFILKS